MHPVLFQLGSLEIYSYGVALVIAFLAGTYFAVKEAPKVGIEPERILDLAILIGVAAIVGARFYYVILNWSYYAENPISIVTRGGGLVFHGGLAAGFLIGLWYVKKHNISVGLTADLVAPFVALGYAITRIGCLLNGCCFGVVSDVPWALPASFLDNALRHPTQLYASLSNLLFFGILMYLRDKKPFNGYLFVVYTGLYGAYRFIVEFFREGDLFLGPITLAQVVSLIMILVSLLLLKFWPWKQVTEAHEQ